ncbi:MAG: DUF3365 domain-containing protein [Pelosinus sp.]|nr:DUF3365 domain-containing protein [Pelosinus sp.]
MEIRNSLSLKFMLSVAAVILTIMTVSLLWNIHQYNRQGEADLKEKAQVICQQLIATRSFIAAKQDTINVDANGRYEFKHLNPAAVGKGISDKFNRFSGYSFKQTRFAVRDQSNAPDNFEVEKMKELAADKRMTEIWGYDEIDNVRVFRYLTPLYYDESCMSCHGQPAGTIDVSGYPREGVSPGDFAGAISVVFPMTGFEAHQYENIISHLVFILFMVMATIGMIYILMKHIVITPLTQLTEKVSEVGSGQWTQLTDIHTYDEMRHLADKFNEMSQNLNGLYNNLESKVAERTRQLCDANIKLAEQSRELREMYEKLFAADQLKSEFLAVMSHELKTPLTAIIAFSEILLSEGEALSSQQKEYLEDIFESSHQLLGQINDILDMSKIEAGLIRLNARSTDVRQILDSVISVMRPLFQRKNIKLTVNCPEEIPIFICDADKLRHIMNNLISNAIKFTNTGGNISIDMTVENAALKVAVCDDGVGISAEDQPYIFDKFRQVHYSHNYENQGSGLGLEIARNLVELQGGLIWVKSELDKGSSFTFTLPLNAFSDVSGEEE